MKNFCIAPWVHMYLHTTGDVRTCCVGKDSIGSSKKDSLRDLWNSDSLKQIRNNLLIGKTITNCETCDRFEENKIHSLRQGLNSLFEDQIEDLKSKTLSDGSLLDFNLQYIDVRYSNFCNFKCRMCYDEYSSSIIEENNKLNKFQKEILIYPGKTEDDIITQILPHIKTARKIYFAGGEPLIQFQHWVILEEMIKYEKFDIEIFYNTNLSSFRYKDKSVLDYWKNFNNIKLMASIDGWKEPIEYWRKGTKWNIIEKNILKIKKTVPHVQLGTTTTIGWPNLWNALDFIEYCIETQFIDVDLINTNTLQTPLYYSLTSLPLFKKKLAKERILITINNLIKSNNTENLLFSNLNGLIRFMESNSTEYSLKDFNKGNGNLDHIRSEDFFKAFPEHIDLKEFLT